MLLSIVKQKKTVQLGQNIVGTVTDDTASAQLCTLQTHESFYGTCMIIL